MAEQEVIRDVAGKGRIDGVRRAGAGRKALLVLGITLALVAAGAAGAFLAQDSLWPPARPPSGPVGLGEHNNTHLSLPSSSVGARAAFFEYNASGTTVRFFVVRDHNGTVRAAFDASAGDDGRPAGFRQSGDAMVHKATGMATPISDLAASPSAGGECHPAPLPCIVEGNEVLFSKSSLMMGASLFRPRPSPAALEEHDAGTVAIPLGSLSAQAAWFEYDIGGAAVRFFAVLDSSGNVRTAFDECPICYEGRMGFRQEGAVMMENCCEMPFPIDGIAPGGEGCHPEHLPSRLQGDRVLISKSDLSAGAWLFGGEVPEPPAPFVTDHNLTHVSIPLGSFCTTAVFFSYDISGGLVRFFAVRDAAGAVHTALDACPNCWKKHAGFRQDGDAMTENCCNMPFSIANITLEGCNRTGCRPAFLASRVEGERLVIAKSALSAGAYMFRTRNESSGIESVNATHIAIRSTLVGSSATWFESAANNTTVRFFAVRDQNGTAHLSLDNCPKCWKKHAGFRQDGNLMVENCCNMGYPLENITAAWCSGRTGCRPAFLPSVEEGGRILIALADLEAGSYMFQTGGR
jgi:uncharacterized membrane protein